MVIWRKFQGLASHLPCFEAENGIFMNEIAEKFVGIQYFEWFSAKKYKNPGIIFFNVLIYKWCQLCQFLRVIEYILAGLTTFSLAKFRRFWDEIPGKNYSNLWNIKGKIFIYPWKVLKKLNLCGKSFKFSFKSRNRNRGNFFLPSLHFFHKWWRSLFQSNKKFNQELSEKCVHFLNKTPLNRFNYQWNSDLSWKFKENYLNIDQNIPAVKNQPNYFGEETSRLQI